MIIVKITDSARSYYLDAHSRPSDKDHAQRFETEARAVVAMLNHHEFYEATGFRQFTLQEA